MTDREKHIKVLEEWRRLMICSEVDNSAIELRSAVDYAISSLKTDEAYQLMYEGEEVYDKDTVVWMFRELQLEIAKMSDTVVDARTVTITSWKGMQKKICDIIQEKIDKLRGQ